jgi:stage II sporulation protein D
MRIALEIDRTALSIQAPDGTQLWAEDKQVGTFRGRVDALLPVSGGEPKILWLQADGGQWEGDRFQLRPEEGKLLRLKNHSYRGQFEIFVNRKRNLTLVNVVELEDYLKGVVPNELSPYLFPEIEALKAQAIAARTYAVRNRGQYATEGFDLFSTIRSQVYGGVESERELSSQAVEQTEGLIAVYNNEPIEALYCSTCGGHTEDSSNVFSSRDVPYLKGVVCLGEAAVSGGEEGGLTIPAEEALEFHLGLVNIAGIDLLSRGEEYLSHPASLTEMQAWTRRVAAFGRRPVTPISDFDVQTFFLWLSRAHGQGEAEGRNTPRDASLLLKSFEDLDLIDLKLRPHVAWLMELRIVEPDGKRLIPPLPLRRGYVLDALGKLLASFQDQFLIGGRIERVNQGSLEINTGRSRAVYSLAPSIVLYRREKQTVVPQNSLRLKGGEQIWCFAEQGTLKLLLVEGGARPANNRLSPYAYWEYKISRSDLSRRINALLSVGTVRDIVPLAHGVSGRVLKLKVISTRGETILSGARLRTALGLKDTLFTLEKSVNDEGAVEQFVFRGRGWGHGVGLCQIGSVGLARQGKNFVEILKSYYTGIEVRPIRSE